ncbi:MAG: Dabb family protein [Bacteroidales bacterium]|nr:Dabb family protein [Bacteroidales bacterium]
MIRHIVMFKLKETSASNKQSLADEIKSRLTTLLEYIPELMSMEVGKNICNRSMAFDLVLISDFKSLNALDKYRNHPMHIEVLEYLKKLVIESTVVDYEL